MKKSTLILAALLTVFTFGFMSQATYAQGAVSGVVVDADAQPVEGAVVNIHSAVRVRGERPFNDRFETVENGAFGWREVPAGLYLVQAGARELGMTSARVEVVDGEVSQLRLQLPGVCEERPERPEMEMGSISGQVTDADGNAVEGAHVSIHIRLDGRGRGIRGVGLRTETDADGMFSFDEAPAGNVTVRAGLVELGFGQETVEVTVDQNVEVNIQLLGREDREGPGDGEGEGPGDRGGRGGRLGGR